MINMSYCRFQNTLQALKECSDALDGLCGELGELSAEERRAAIQLVRTCDAMARDYCDAMEQKP